MAIYEDKIECRTCKETKSHTEFPKMLRWSSTQEVVTEHLNSRQCNECGKIDAKIRRELEKEYPYPEKEVCGCCGTDFTNYPKREKRYLVLDHCHDTGTFRNYVCTRCNTSVGGLGDNREKILKRTEYLKPENIVKAQNKYRKKDYISNSKTINNNSKTINNNMNSIDLMRAFVDAGDITYAMKVLELSDGLSETKSTKTKSEFGETVTNGILNTTGLDSKTGEKRRARKKFVGPKLKEFDSSKNLMSVKDKWGWKANDSLYSRTDDFINAVSSSLHLSPNGNKSDLYVDVDSIPAGI